MIASLARGLGFLGCALLAACCLPQEPARTGEWTAAIVASAVPDPTAPVRPLTPIRQPRASLVTWKRVNGDPPSPGAHRFGRPLWATVDGELQTFCRRFVSETHPSADALRARVEKVLGLPDGDGTGRVIVSFSVDAAQVFRPCADPAIDTTACPATLDDAALKAALDRDPAAARFLLEHMLASYVQRDGYPFTRRGFTYDRDAGSVSHFGLSEYVTRADAAVEIIAVTGRLETYCAPQ